MGLVVFPFVNILLPPLLLLDHGSRHDIHLPAVSHPFSSIIANNNNKNDILAFKREPHRHRYQDVGDVDNDGATVTATTTTLLSSSEVSTGNSPYSWNLPNGNVRFESPLSFAGIEVRDGRLKSDPASPPPSSSPSSMPSSISLWDPTFLGSGGSGAVFSFSTSRPNYFNSQPSGPKDAAPTENRVDDDDDDMVAIKVSWKRSRSSVENECDILHSLENVPHVERCLGVPNAYPYEEGRVMIALAPVVVAKSSDPLSDGGITSSLNNVRRGAPQRNAVRGVVEAMVGMLRVGVYTLDVQPLVMADTGEVMFIDFTEAKHFSDPLTPSDESSLVGFCSEMIALIPDALSDVAVEDLVTELNGVRVSGSSRNDEMPPLPEKVVDILENMWMDTL